MSNTPSETPKSIEERSAELLAKENNARRDSERAEENFTIAEQGFGADYVSDEAEREFDDDLYYEEGEAGRRLNDAVDAFQGAVEESDKFGHAYMDELHAAALAEDAQRKAIAEAAQRVTDAYDSATSSEEK